MTELDKYELKPGGYYAIKFPDRWTPEQVGSYLKYIAPLLGGGNTPYIIPLFNGMELAEVEDKSFCK